MATGITRSGLPIRGADASGRFRYPSHVPSWHGGVRQVARVAKGSGL